MPTTTYPASGLPNFIVTTSNSGIPLFTNYTSAVTITHANNTTESFTSGFPSNLIVSTSAGTGPAVTLVGQTYFFDVPGVAFNYTIASLLGTANFYIGGTSTISNLLGVVSGTNIEVDGGSATYSIGIAGVTAASALNVTIDDGGTFAIGTNQGSLLSANLIAGSSFSFGTGGGTLVLGDSPSFLNLSALTTTSINGFNTINGDYIDDKAVNFSAVASYTITASGANQLITFYNGAGGTGTSEGNIVVTGHSLIQGTFTAGGTNDSLNLADDGSGGVKFTPEVLCFLGGTHIATTNGETRVEALRMGDMVVTASGDLKPVRWIGVHTVAARDADPIRYLPVRIKAGALGENLPVRDLLVSPDHAMFVDGVLIQASALVNGSSVVRQEMSVETFVYYHVEVEGHSLILAEGAPTETFVDNADRMAFDNWADFVALYGNDVTVAEMDYPRAMSPRQIPGAVQARLATAAEMLGARVAVPAL